MSRSSKKGPYVDKNLIKKANAGLGTKDKPIKTWARSSQIPPDFVGKYFQVYNGRLFIDVFITEDMVGHRFGEFSPTTKFVRHGGKVQKALDQKK